jgi:hypothetical protein
VLARPCPAKPPADPADCAALLPRIHDTADAHLRYHIVQTESLGCLDRAALESLTRGDADAEVRALAARLLKKFGTRR